jgi:peroxiredoxin Q/BCP
MKSLWTLLIGVGAVMSAGMPAEAAELKVGGKAPEFEMKGSDGKTYKLSQFKDKKAVVVAWYPKAFTGGWTAECKSLRASGKALREYNVAYFTASCDPVEKNTRFAKELELDYPILSDPDKKVAKAYGILSDRGFSNRVTFIVGKDGKILHIIGVGKDNKVKSSDHGKQILEQLAKLKIEKAPKKKSWSAHPLSSFDSFVEIAPVSEWAPAFFSSRHLAPSCSRRRAPSFW